MQRALPLDRFEDVALAPEGLTTAQVEARRMRYGANHIVESAPRGWLGVLRDTAADPMLWFLVVTGGIFALLGEWTEAAVLFAALVPFLGMDAYLHRRTQASTQGLSAHLAAQANVMRDGTRRTIAASAIVPGDLVLVSAGDAFPADGVLVQGAGMQADESSLTGEAFPVRKAALEGVPRSASDPGVDSAHWGYAGTRLLTGEGALRVAYIGAETVYGEIVRSAIVGTRAKTPLQQAVARLVVVLLAAAAVACIAIAWVRLRQGHGVFDAVLSAVTLAVAALPEEYPVVLTFFLGVGVYRLARRRALVRRAVVVENIGRVSCICSDKTGTITEGRLTLAHCVPAEGLDEARLLRLAAGASRRETGDPMDAAILDAAGSTPLGAAVASFPFTEDRKRETGIVRVNGALLAVVKGAPETVFAQCSMEPGQLQRWRMRVDEFAAGGHKVIACASLALDAPNWHGGEPDRNFGLAGLMCFEDPVRPGVAEAVQECRRAGIRVLMITGDHPVTARSVARDIGLGAGEPRVVESDDLTERLAHGDASTLDRVDVIARAMPSQKLDVVRALQAAGEIVAVTGDGVNDVPALLAADIGIAMGGRGTRSAREVAAIVLLDDDFSSIVSAIREGRQLFTNLQASFQYLLMIHLPLVLTATLLPLAGYPLLYLPVHVVWLELIIHPTALLVFQEMPPRGDLRSMRRQAPSGFFSRREWATIVATGGVVTAVVGLTYLRSLGADANVEHARAMAMVALSAASAGITASLTGLRGAASRIVVLGVLVLTIVLVQVPVLSRLLHLEPLHADDWMLAIGGGLLASLVALVGSSRRSADDAA